MGKAILDQKLLDKLEGRLKKPLKSIRETISKRAAKHSVSSRVALVAFAKKNGLGTAIYQSKLSPVEQEQLRQLLLSDGPKPNATRDQKPQRTRAAVGKRSSLRQTVGHLIQDKVLLVRCKDLLTASSNYDRAINQATQILEDRIRKKANLPKRQTGEQLVGSSFNEEPSKTVLLVEGGEADDQRGFTQILRGIVPAFRNKTHHHIVESFSQEDAIRIVAFIDVLLRVVDGSTNTKLSTKDSGGRA